MALWIIVAILLFGAPAVLHFFGIVGVILFVGILLVLSLVLIGMILKPLGTMSARKLGILTAVSILGAVLYGISLEAYPSAGSTAILFALIILAIIFASATRTAVDSENAAKK